MSPPSPTLAKKSSGSLLQLILATVPLLGVLIYFLYEAWERPTKEIYNLADDYTQEEWDWASEETGSLISLMDMLLVFLTLLLLWTMFAVYVVIFIPKRRRLIGRYLEEGKTVIGDVHYDRTSRMCGSFHDYGYAIYAHPTEQKVVRKRVRVYQGHTREKIAILLLPNRPLSGQAKIDLEIDLMAATEDRDSRNKLTSTVSISWALFTLLGATYVLYQMNQINDPNVNASRARKVYLVVAGLNVPLAFGINYMRFVMYTNWLINRGAIVNDMQAAKNPKGCIVTSVPSEDGSETIPYSILGEEDCSFTGDLPHHVVGTVDIKRKWVVF
jgi:hypothetical protein